MNLDLIFALIFYGIIFLLFVKYRNKFEVQNKIFVLYKTKLGIKLMNKLSSKIPRILHYISYLSITIGFIGMIITFLFLIKGVWNMIFIPNAIPVLAPVLPGVSIPGVPTLSFWHWIIAILITAVVHEFFHGVYASLAKVKIKSSGFAFLGPILAAFVEPDEKQLAKKSTHKQLSVLSAGPFSNIVLAFVFFLIGIFIIAPVTSSILELNGIQIVDINKDLPIAQTSLKSGDQILAIDNETVINQTHFSSIIKSHKPGDILNIQTQDKIIPVELSSNPENKSLPIMGVTISYAKADIKPSIKKIFGNTPLALFWILKLVFWVYAINLGVGLFNLLPLGPVDGGRMFYSASLFIFKKQEKAKKAYQYATLICLLLIFINLSPYIIKLLAFLIQPLVALL